jgi:DNA mismatch repair protein MutS
MPKTAQLTPMLRHYLELKAGYPDALLFYRMGDFYELFFEDAQRAAPVLEVTLTARQRGTESEAPMCGVPHHALEVYLAKAVRAGLKVAVCDQVEDPSRAKGLVRREVTRVVTPGTVTDPELLAADEDNFLVAVTWEDDGGAGAFLDLSTGAFFARRWSDADTAVDELQLRAPRELLIVDPPSALPPEIGAWAERGDVCVTHLDDGSRLDRRQSRELLERQLGIATLRGFGVEEGEPSVRAAAAALDYARTTQQSDLSHVREFSVGEQAAGLILDATTLANLEVFAPARGGGRRWSLLGVLDRTLTPGGGRLLRRWLQLPLRQPEAVESRLEAVEELSADPERRLALAEQLAAVGDPERLLSRAVLGRLRPREAAVLRDALTAVPRIQALVADGSAELLRRVAAADPLSDLQAELEATLEESPPAAIKEGGVIRSDVDPELDRVRSLAADGKKHLLALERRERERTGIGSLKVRFNKVFGYYLEVTKANQKLVPDDYIRKQTLANAERYVTPELKELEESILAAEQDRARLEEELYARLLQRIAGEAERLRALAGELSSLDALLSFAEQAVRHRYVRPEIRPAGEAIDIRGGRHPVVERAGDEPFVPNDAELDCRTSQIVLLTGPNMGGKSTYLRQVALIVLMSQAGSFVPADSARIAVVDRIFTRVGASDDLTRGESTFMTEMIETANILHQSTADSLVILDEVGRGTATFDGLSLAWAIVEHLHEHRRPRTLFATHYHELTELASLLPRVVNRTMAVKEWEGRIVFLRRVVAGTADKSYGLHVARLAGIPPPVVDRAAEVLANLESAEYDLSGRPRLARGHAPESAKPDQMPLFAPPEQVVASILADVEVERLSPLAALNLLQALKSRLGG